MAEVTKHHAGAYKCQFNLSGDGSTMVNLGYTEEGFDWRIVATSEAIREDRFGRTPVNALLLGIEAMSVEGVFTWFTQNLQKALNPQIDWATGKQAYSAGSQVSPGYGNGTGAKGAKFVLTRITGTVDDNTLRILEFPRAFSRGDMILKLAASQITKSRAVFDALPKVGSSVGGDDGSGTEEPQWFTPTWGAAS